MPMMSLSFMISSLFTVEGDLGARPFAEQDAVAVLDVHRDAVAVIVARAGADGHDDRLRRAFPWRCRG